jgi:uridine kinase
MNYARQTLLDGVAEAIDAVRIGHPLRVAVDGRTAAGKTTFADELALILRNRGREVIRTSIDGFHRSRAQRYRRGRHSAVGYYEDARDLAAVNRYLLAPLGPNGDRRYRTATFDLSLDRPVDQTPIVAGIDDILIVDGTFLQRPELRDSWDVIIFLEVAEETAISRGAKRDAQLFGDEKAAEEMQRSRYQAAFKIYEEKCEPLRCADIVIDNGQLEALVLRNGLAGPKSEHLAANQKNDN